MFRNTFLTQTEDEGAYSGQPYTLLDSIETEDHPAVIAQEIDPEVLPMYHIRFADGHETHAFAEEVRADWD
jgi:hypothetical protein